MSGSEEMFAVTGTDSEEQCFLTPLIQKFLDDEKMDYNSGIRR